ncbi:MAG: 30S ribosomal protein S20 [bacterium]
MANTKSAKKHIEINRRNRLRNQHYKTRMKNVLKSARAAIVNAEVSDDDAKSALRSAQSTLLSTASRGVIHKNTASRKISRLVQLFRRARVEKTEQLVEAAKPGPVEAAAIAPETLDRPVDAGAEAPAADTAGAGSDSSASVTEPEQA